jgi:hypothetical protein
VFFVSIETWLARLKQHPDYPPLPVSDSPLPVGKESPRA